MSYREIRNFTEMMRALGYPRLISIENFRKPNFELVADILYWMVKLYDPETTISDRVEFEDERVEFLTGIAALMATKARLKMNTKKLYASDGRAVQELLKLATLLYKATKSMSKRNEEDSVVPPPIKTQDVKSARILASEITQSGAKLYDLLETETTDRQERARALRFLDQSSSASDGPREQAYIERSIRDLIEKTKQGVEDMRKEGEELEADERNIDAKIKKKQEELERTEKRLKSLENVKPQFVEEAERLEKELQRYYDVYMDKHRNLDYLEHELDKYRRNEEERKEEQDKKMKKMRERLLKEEVDLMRGGREEGGGGGANGMGYNSNAQGKMGSGRGGESRSAKIQGSMRGQADDSSDPGSESDDGRRGRGGGGRGRVDSDEEEDDSEEEISINPNNRAGGGRPGSAEHKGYGARKQAVEQDDFLDDDDDMDDDGDDDDEDGGDGGDFSGSDDF